MLKPLKVLATKEKRGYNHDTLTETITKTEIAYWRKHNALEGWMAELYESRGGDGEFNCKTLHLYPEDLDDLKKVVTEGDLPKTVGFFFGECTKDCEEYKELDLEFIEDAKKAIEEGYSIEYVSSW
mgnify:CR=1 FL=1